jgi:hypothetical protein
MGVSYDSIFTCFMENCRGSQKSIPSSDEGKYEMIHNACRHYGNKTEEVALVWDDITETLNVELDDDRLLILAYCIKLAYHENELTEFTSIFATFQKEIGFSSYQAQVKAREANVIRTEQKITELITNISSFSIM